MTIIDDDNDQERPWLNGMHPESAPVEVLHVWCASASPAGPYGTFSSEAEAAAFVDIVEPYVDGDAYVVERIDYALLRRRIPRLVYEGFDSDDAA